MANQGFLERIEHLKSRVLSTWPEMDLENAVIYTGGMQESEGEPLYL